MPGDAGDEGRNVLCVLGLSALMGDHGAGKSLLRRFLRGLDGAHAERHEVEAGAQTLKLPDP